MTDFSKNITNDKLLLVPAWDKAALAEHGDAAVGVLPDMGYIDAEDYGKPETFKRPGMFSRFNVR